MFYLEPNKIWLMWPLLEYTYRYAEEKQDGWKDIGKTITNGKSQPPKRNFFSNRLFTWDRMSLLGVDLVGWSGLRDAGKRAPGCSELSQEKKACWLASHWELTERENQGASLCCLLQMPNSCWSLTHLLTCFKLNPKPSICLQVVTSMVLCSWLCSGLQLKFCSPRSKCPYFLPDHSLEGPCSSWRVPSVSSHQFSP